MAKTVADAGRLGGLATMRKRSPAARRAYASQAGRAAWAGMTKEQRQEVIRKRFGRKRKVA